MVRDLAAIPRALLRPDRAFAEHGVYRLPKSLENAHAKELALAEAGARLDSLMTTAPPEAKERAREQMVGSILGQQSTLFTALSIAFSGLFFFILMLEMWLISTVSSQFFGGQEDRHGRDRPSLTLFLVAFFPLALRKLLAGIVLATKNPEAASNALTLTDYRAVSAVHFDFFSLLPPIGVPEFIASIARLVTDPFFLWTLAVVILGGRVVYRVSARGAVAQTAIVVLVLALQAALLKSIGITMEI
jgi:uncharacterized membrane protein YdbT with pleckstrin-like domain